MKKNKKSKHVFNISSVTTRMIDFANSNDHLLKGRYGIGKSYTFALNNYITFLVWKMQNVWGEQTETKMKDMIS